MIGIIARLNLKINGLSAPAGRRCSTKPSLSLTSFAAASKSVPQLNFKVIEDTPSVEDDSNLSRLEIVAICSSTGLVTEVSISSGPAPW